MRTATGCSLAITPKGRPRSLIGAVGIEPHGETGKPYLGYWLGTPHWGEGYATEAARALIDAFFAYGGAVRADLGGAGDQPGLPPGHREVRLRLSSAPASWSSPARGGFFPVDHFRLDRRAWESLKTWGHTGLVREPAVPDAGPPSLVAQ